MRGLGVCNNVFMTMVVNFLKRSVTVTINLCYGEWLQEFPKFSLKWRRIRILKSLNFSIESTCIMLSLVIGLLTPHLLVKQHLDLLLHGKSWQQALGSVMVVQVISHLAGLQMFLRGSVTLWGTETNDNNTDINAVNN